MGFRGHRGALHLSVLICQRGRVCFGRRLPGGACPLAQSPVGGGAPGALRQPAALTGRGKHKRGLPFAPAGCPRCDLAHEDAQTSSR